MNRLTNAPLRGGMWFLTFVEFAVGVVGITAR
jgi:hypothetical protein